MNDAPDTPPKNAPPKEQNPGYNNESSIVERLRMPEDSIDFNPERAVIISRPSEIDSAHT
jgi:hypothetical protein